MVDLQKFGHYIMITKELVLSISSLLDNKIKGLYFLYQTIKNARKFKIYFKALLHLLTFSIHLVIKEFFTLDLETENQILIALDRFKLIAIISTECYKTSDPEFKDFTRNWDGFRDGIIQIIDKKGYFNLSSHIQQVSEIFYKGYYGKFTQFNEKYNFQMDFANFSFSNHVYVDYSNTMKKFSSHYNEELEKAINWISNL
ncbi:hypothetical protein M0812_02139 [Anaeramoeba flamelloides]|uniref:Uncharacterized protein n=1 Tax=Anaeramoeba flamelloides TaxID=1746091 RepID=A0AAV7Z5S2_9EUKA|nr:hypothetical protein M0812_02139 [Anaeramoeba flamelloides]